ncbi:MAG TPA: hypothetical protein VFU38_10150 [Candidatus Krumholzibacteria bacterium]|nr:hypothetical protein [Candidatus Krumholzibacteria bacterium]
MLLVAALATTVAGCGDDEVVPPVPLVWTWEYSHPRPHGATIRGLGAWTEFDQWAVGDGGLIARWRGNELDRIPSPTSRTLHDVVAFSPSEVFMVGDGGTIVGPGIARMTSPTTNHLYSLFGSSSSNLIAVGAAGTILEYDGGEWETVTSPTSSDLHGVWELPSGPAYAVGAGGVVITSSGADWSLVPAFTARDLNAVWADKPNDWFAVGDGGEIWQNRGGGWTAMTSPRGDDLHDVFGSDSAYVWAVGDTDSILFYDQISWQPYRPNPSGHLDAISAFICPLISRSAREDVHCSNTYFAGAGGVFTRYTLLNTYDVISDALTYAHLRGIHGRSSGDLYAVGDAGTVLRFDGSAWSLSPAGVGENLNDAFMLSALDVVIVGDGGRILRGADVSWVPMTSGTIENLHGVWAQNANHVFAVGDAGIVLRYDGVNWNPENAPVRDYTDVWGLDNGDVVAVARGGFVSRRVAGTWSDTTTPPATSDLHGVWGQSNERAFAVGDGGTVLSLVAGAWHRLNGLVTADLIAVSGSGSLVMVAGRSGTILRLEGSTWSVGESPPVESYGGVFVRSAGHVFAAGSLGNLVRFDRTNL